MSDSEPTSPPPGSEAPRPISPARRKRKPRPWMREKEARRRMKQCARDASELVEEASRIAGTLSQNAGVRSLRIGLEALLTILTKIQAMKTKVEGVDTLYTQVTNLKKMLEQISSQYQDLPADMQQRVKDLSTLWERIAEDTLQVKCRGIIKRFFTSNVDAMKMQGFVQEVSESIQNYVSQSMNIEATVHVVRQDVSVVRQNVGVHRDVGTVRQDVKALKTHVEMSMLSTYAKRAQYNSSSVRRECLEGTRKDVLADAYSWIHESSEEVASCSKSGHLLWINGWAGTGKTAIACSIAKKYDDEGVLSANFFCSRTDAECRDPNRIFVTIARQLCQYHEPFKEKVMAALKRTPDVVHAKPLDQFKVLILQPLRELEGVFPTCVIVIDALDECDNTGLQSVILDILARHIRELAPFLFVVTSRPEPHITAFFEKANEVSLKDSTQPLVLHNVRLELVLDDIRRYLIDGFREIRETFTLEADWPSVRDMARLTELSKGLFIFATTVLRFIGDTDSDPKEQLQALLSASVSIMHDLYREVLALAFKDVNTLHKTNPSLRRVLGAITLAEEPLSAAALADLLGMSEGDVRNRLARLRSVLYLPEEGSVNTIRFIHPTFPEFLLDGSLDKPEAFHIIPVEHHLNLFMRSLVAMDSLKRNIAGIERSAAFRSEVPGLSDTVKRCVPAHVAYASRFWSIHLSRCASGTLGQDARNLLHGFLTRQMLYWLEVCSLLRVLDGALTALETAEYACQNYGVFDSVVELMLADCHRFLSTYYYCIDTAPLQVYHSALALAPTESLMKKAYTRELDSSLIVRSGALSGWPPRREAFSGHDGKTVCAIVFSSGGDYFVSAGGDRKLKMWKPSTRTLVQSFDGHTSVVNCVALSPDGAYVASGSDDRSARVWQLLLGECVHILEGHTSGVWSVAYSEDGRRILSATYWGEVKLWDTADGRCIITLDTTGNHTLQAGLSPAGGVIARGSGASLSLHDVSSATDETIDFPDTVIACTFSPDGRLVAARSRHVIRVWQCADKSLVRSIDAPEVLSARLAFSRDGTRIACGSVNGSVFLWLVASGAFLCAFEQLEERIQDVSWRPGSLDRTQIIAAGSSSIFVWDAPSFTDSDQDQIDPCLAMVRGHEGQPIRSVAFSPDGSRFATGGDDGVVKIWTAGCMLKAIIDVAGRCDWVHTVAYSPNGTQIAIGWYGGAVTFWDIQTDSPLLRLSYDAQGVSFRLLGYSPTVDCHCVVSITDGDVAGLPTDQSINPLVLPDGPPLSVPVSLGCSYAAYTICGAPHVMPLSRNTTHPQLPRFLQAVTTVALSSNDRYLAYTTFDEIHIWSFRPRLGEPITRKIEAPQRPHHLSFSRDSKMISCSCDDGSLTLWDTESDRPELTRTLRLGGRSVVVNGVSWGSRDLQVVSVGQDGFIHSWRTDVNNGGSGSDSAPSTTLSPIAIFRESSTPGHMPFALSELPQHSSSPVQVARLVDLAFAWNVALHSEVAKKATIEEITHACSLSQRWECLTGKHKFLWRSAKVAAAERGDVLAYPLRDTPHVIQVYNIDTKSCSIALTLEERSSAIYLTAFSPSGLLLAAISEDKAVTVWSIETEKDEMRHAGWEEGRVRTVAFSPNDRFIALGLDDATLHILEISTRHESQVFSLPRGNVIENVMFAADNEHIVAQDQRNHLYVWNVHVETEVSLSSMEHRSWLRSLRFIPDDTGIYLQGRGEETVEIRLWEPGSRSWPIYDVDEDGWVYAKAPRMERMQRLCWIPCTWWVPLSSDEHIFYLYSRHERKITSLDLSRL